jgi:hypothetical protein
LKKRSGSEQGNPDSTPSELLVRLLVPTGEQAE